MSRKPLYCKCGHQKMSHKQIMINRKHFGRIGGCLLCKCGAYSRDENGRMQKM